MALSATELGHYGRGSPLPTRITAVPGRPGLRFRFVGSLGMALSANSKELERVRPPLLCSTVFEDEGCTVPYRRGNPLPAAVCLLVAGSFIAQGFQQF